MGEGGKMRQLAGPSLVGLAALLWATDTPFRLPTIQKIDVVHLVLFEHLVGTAALVLWALARKKQDLLRLKFADWLCALAIGVGGSALATVLFTASFRHINPSLTILLQKIQPVLVVLLSFALLKERPREGFYKWALLALAAATVLSFPDFNFSFLRGGIDFHSLGVIYALGAAALWALSTVLGKLILRRNSPGTVTFWRYLFGLLTLMTLAFISGGALPEGIASDTGVLWALLYISLIPGLLAMIAYYFGLFRTPASVATLVELIYPLSAIAINTLVLNAPLNPVQLGAGAVLLLAVTALSLR